MARSPLILAASATTALPGTVFTSARALTENAGGRFDSALARTDDGREVVVRMPAGEEGAHDLAAESRALHALTAGVRALLPFSSSTDGGENPFVVQLELQKTMNDLVGIIRKADEMELALKALQDIAIRTRTVSVLGGREFNPGWHLALDLRNMLLVSLCVARAALERQESRGGHTRDDYPAMDSDWRHVLLVLRALGEDDVELVRQEQVPMRPELFDLFELDELKKYYTGEELGGHRAGEGLR